jgi:hypothetical protein
VSHLFLLDRSAPSIQMALNTIDYMGGKTLWRHESALVVTVLLIRPFNLKYDHYVTLVSVCLQE